MNISNEDFLMDIPSFDTLKEKIKYYDKKVNSKQNGLIKIILWE